MKSYRNFVNGELVGSVDGREEPIISPVDERTLGTVPTGSEKDVDRAVGAAAAAFVKWQDSTPARAEPHAPEARRPHREERRRARGARGRQRRQADRTGPSEVPFMVDNLRFFAGACRVLEGKAAGEYLAGYTSMIRREPIGVVGSIAPWNYPLMMAIWKIGPALAAGNTVVLKPSEQTPLTTLRLAELAGDVFPPGVFNVITGHGEPVGAALVRTRASTWCR